MERIFNRLSLSHMGYNGDIPERNTGGKITNISDNHTVKSGRLPLEGVRTPSGYKHCPRKREAPD